MLTTLQLRFCAAPVRPAVAWFLPGADPAAWLDELSQCSLAQADTRLFVVPRSLTDRAPAGLLVVPAAGVQPAQRPAGLACGVAGGRLYLPVDAQLSAPVRDTELRALCRMSVLFFHPVLGLSGFEETTLRVGDLLGPPAERRADWNRAQAGPPLPARLGLIVLAQPPTLQDVYGDAGQEIGTEPVQELPPAPGEPRDDAVAKAGRHTKQRFAQLIAGLAASLPHTGSRRTWINRLEEWAARQAHHARAELENLRHKELRRLCHLLEHDPEAGLRHAIRLSQLPHRGRGAPGAKLGPHSVDFNAGRLSGGPADFWHVPFNIEEELRRRYHELAKRELRLGHFRRAAYIYAELLGDLASAANTLRQGRHYREAALLYLESLHNPLQAALCLAEGGLLHEAIDIYEKHNLLLEASELYERLGETDQARAALRRLVDQQLAAQDRLKAAELLENRLHSPDEALVVLEQGWPGSKQAASCLRAQFDLLGRLGRHEGALQRVARLTLETAPSWAVLPLARLLAAHAIGYPDQRVRHVAADLARTLISQGLSVDELSRAEAAEFVAELVRLAPQDRLLARDGQRHLADRWDDTPGAPQRPRRRFLPSIWRQPERVRSFELPRQIIWLAACRAGRFFLAAGSSGHRLTLVRGAFDGQYQSRSWAVPEVPTRPDLLLAADPSDEDYAAVALRGQEPLVPQCFPAVDKTFSSICRAGTPGWLPLGSLGLALAGRVAWTVHLASARRVATCHTLEGNVIHTEDITAPLCEGTKRTEPTPLCLAAHPAGAMVAWRDQLVLARPNRLALHWDLPGAAFGLVPTPPGELGGALVLLEWGAVLHWMGCDELLPVDGEIDSPHGAFLPDRRIVLVSRGTGKLLTFDGRSVRNAQRFKAADAAVMAVLPGEAPGEFAVFYPNGRVDCFSAAD